MQAARRGAELTHHLLAFSRQQVLQPRAVSVRELLAEVEGLISRTLDPRIAIDISQPIEDFSVLADEGQLQSALLNLAVNARDAMPGGCGSPVLSGSTRAAAGRRLPSTCLPPPTPCWP